MLVLSLFPGIGLLDMAFEAEGFCVVRGPDLLWGGDIRRFHPLAGKFDGVIGGPPCQAFSPARGGTAARYGDLTPEFERVVAEAQPDWWVMENVKDAPIPSITGYRTHAQLVNNRAFGAAQRRARRISSNLRLVFPGVALEAIDYEPAATTSVWRNGRQEGARTRKDYVRVRASQGLPDDFELPGFTVEAAVRAVVNGVPLPLGRAIARAVKAAAAEPEP